MGRSAFGTRGVVCFGGWGWPPNYSLHRTTTRNTMYRNLLDSPVRAVAGEL